jgi:hypothetical protein
MNRHKASRYRVAFSETDYKTLASGYTLNGGPQIKNSIDLARKRSMPILHRAVPVVVDGEVGNNERPTKAFEQSNYV